ncbi:MAG: tetratricopeptide repeat protein, partial [Deltaproteobacteria bacterium]|nr:tetratricopeptide repeat protein [Deltaproteobacteria bacterium]
MNANKKSRWFFLSVLFYFLALHSKEHVIMLPLVMICLAFLLNRLDRKNVTMFAGPFLLFAAAALHVVFFFKGVLASPYEPHASLGIESLKAQAAAGPDLQNIYFTSVLNQSWYFFRYLFLWLLPDVRSLAIDLPVPFFTSLVSVQLIMGLILFAAYPVGALMLLAKRGLKGLLGFALLFPWIMFATEVVTVRFHEGFVLYRSYIWMFVFFACLPFFGALIHNRWARRLQIVLACLYCLLLMAALQHRIRPFETPVTLWADVVKKFDIADRRIPSAYRAYNNLATAYGNGGNISLAKENYRIAIGLNPEYDLALYGMGMVLYIEKNYQEAVSYLKRAIAVNPAFQPASYRLGMTYVALHDKAEAERYFQFSEFPQDGPTVVQVYNLANQFYNEGAVADAVKLYKRVVALDPKDISATHNLAIALAALDKHAEAIAYYDTVIGLDQGFAKAYYNKGNSLFKMGRYTEAYELYQKALEHDTNYVQALHNAGLTLIKLNDLPKARAYFERALKIKPDDPSTLEMLGRLKEGL